MNAKYPTPILEKAWEPEEFQTANTDFTGRVSGATSSLEKKMSPWAAEKFIVPAREGRCHAIIENIAPEIDAGRVFIKRTVGETVTVAADIFADGHDSLTSWARFWTRWASAIFYKAYLKAAGAALFLPPAEADLQMMTEVLLLRNAICELGHELNHRPDWVKIALQEIRALMEPENSA